MPRTKRPSWQKLTWHKPRRRWKKFEQGKTYYLGETGLNKTDRAGHDRALAEWHRIEQGIAEDAEAAARQEVKERHPKLAKKVETARAAVAVGDTGPAWEPAG